MPYKSAGPVPNAKLVRATLKAADLDMLVRKVSSGTRNTWVCLHWTDSSDDLTEAAVAALRALWIDGKTRVRVLTRGMIVITRAGLRTWVAEEIVEVVNSVGGGWRMIKFADGTQRSVTTRELTAMVSQRVWSLSGVAQMQLQRIDRELEAAAR
jgi:hypothetical protein